MNWKVVTIGAGCLAAAAVKLINDAANKHYRNVSEAKAKNDISSDTIGEIQDAEDMLKMAEDVTKREHKRIRNWLSITMSVKTRLTKLMTTNLRRLRRASTSTTKWI